MQFIKMHGIGNDYVYVNGFAESVADPAGLAKIVADRHFGIGGDGLILVLPPDEAAAAAGAHVRMRMFNADGSEAEMCGNGVRCVCKLAYDHDVTPGIRDANPMRVQTGNGVLELAYALGHDGKVAAVTVDMGEPILAANRIPVRIPDHPEDKPVVDFTFDGWPGTVLQAFALAESDCGMTCVSMGNPHAVFFCDNAAAVPLSEVGPILEHFPLFPSRINVHFVQVHGPDEVTMRTWERGSGITLACGTGASAVCVAGVLTQRTDEEITAHLPGGDLDLEWRESSKRVYMTGAATEVFTGDFPLSEKL